MVERGGGMLEVYVSTPLAVAEPCNRRVRRSA